MDAPSLRCATCGSAALQADPGGALVCARCGAVSEVPQRTCPQCQTTNPLEAERCHTCGRSFDVVRSLLQDRVLTPAERLEQVRERAGAMKEEAEAVSQERLRQWWKDDEERRHALAQARVERDRQERMLLVGAIVFAVVVLAGLVIYTVVTARGGGTPAVTPTPLP